MKSHGQTGFLQLVRERFTRDAIYHAPSYWDARASARAGMARSMWPSNQFNELWDVRQRSVLARVLGDVKGRRILDVGCGTGRMTRFLIDRGAREVVGVDFSAKTVDAAREETRHLLPPSEFKKTRFDVADVLSPLAHVGVDSFDDVVVIGCLSVACRSGDDLARALSNIAKTARAGGRIILLEPIHKSPLLRRVLDLGIEEWISAANRAGLRVVGSDRMGFAPVRLVFSVRDTPRALVAPFFYVGERILDAAPYLQFLADYKLLVFEVASATSSG